LRNRGSTRATLLTTDFYAGICCKLPTVSGGGCQEGGSANRRVSAREYAAGPARKENRTRETPTRKLFFSKFLVAEEGGWERNTANEQEGSGPSKVGLSFQGGCDSNRTPYLYSFAFGRTRFLRSTAFGSKENLFLILLLDGLTFSHAYSFWRVFVSPAKPDA